MAENDIKIKAFDFASDTTKQLINISTAIIALMVTFSKDIIGETKNIHTGLLIWTWAIFIVSIIFGVLTLMALTGTLQPKATVNPPQGQQTPSSTTSQVDLNINNKNIRLFSFIQVLTFLVAIILTGLFGYKTINSNKSDKNLEKYKVIRKSMLNNDSTTIYYDTLYLDKK